MQDDGVSRRSILCAPFWLLSLLPCDTKQVESSKLVTSEADLYHYRGVVIPWKGTPTKGWHDGDTFACDVDLGVNAHYHCHVRCGGYDSAEVTRSTKWLGYKIRDIAENLMPVGSTVYLNSIAFQANDEKDNFGRMLAYITLPDGRELLDIMLAIDGVVPYTS